MPALQDILLRGQAPAPEEPELGGVLGRAIARARRTGQRPEEGRTRDEFPGTTGDLLRSPPGAAGIALFAACAAGVMVLLRDDWYGMVLSLGGLVIAFWSAGQVVQRRLGARLAIVVGADGVLVRGRFVPYASIRSVHHTCLHLHNPAAASNLWTASLELVGGGRIHLCQGFALGLRHPRVSEVAGAVEEARAAWVAGHRGAGSGDELFTRGERSSAEWVRALRRPGSSGGAVYRAVNVDIEQASRLLADPGAPPSARAAAAVVLSACGDRTAATKLRIAAGAMANPRLRVALERVSAADDEAALAAALEEILEEDGARIRRTPHAPP